MCAGSASTHCLLWECESSPNRSYERDSHTPRPKAGLTFRSVRTRHVYGSANLVQTLMKHDLCRHKHQPHRIFSDNIALHQSQWRTRRGEVWLAAAQHEWTQIKAIFVDQTKLSKTPRKLRPRNVDVAIDLRLQPRSERAHIIHHKRGIGANRLQRVRCNPFRLRAPRRRKVALTLVPVWLVLIPITHHLIHAPSIQHSRKPTHVIVEMATQRRSRRRQHRASRHFGARRRSEKLTLSGNVSIERLHHPEHQPAHSPPPAGFVLHSKTPARGKDRTSRSDTVATI